MDSLINEISNNNSFSIRSDGNFNSSEEIVNRLDQYREKNTISNPELGSCPWSGWDS